MGFIKIRIASRKTDDEGYAERVSFRALESDMANEKLYELNVIMHALALKGKVVKNNGFPYYFPFPLG